MSTKAQHTGRIPARGLFAYDPSMAATAIGDTSIVGALCLGLLMQRPDSAQSLDRRLRRAFPSAKFTRGAAGKALARLEEQALIELVQHGSKRTLDKVQPTPAGRDYFIDWLHHAEVDATVRDALQYKLEFFEIEDVPELIELIEALAEAFTHASDVAHEALDKEKRRRRIRSREGHPPDWSLDRRILKTKDAAKLGTALVDRLEELLENVKELGATYQQSERG
jgi:DNA-binding PadR family transcriptional regulator